MSYAQKNLKLKSLRSKNNPINRDLLLRELLLILPNVDTLRDDNLKDVYRFRLNQSTNILGKKFPPGKFVLKYYTYTYVNNIEILLTLSQYKLIPKIYIITNKFIIMKYVSGIPFTYIFQNYSKYKLEIILNNLEQTIKLWHRLGFFHGDIGFDGNNVIIDPDNLDIYLIDPIIDDLEHIKFLTKTEIDVYFHKDLIRLAFLRNKLLHK